MEANGESAEVHPTTPPQGTPDPGDRNGGQGGGVLVVQGIFDPPGEKLVKLGPIRRFDWEWKASPFERKGFFLVTVIEMSGEVVTEEFDALVADDTENEVAEHGFFEVFLPVKGGIASIIISDGTGEKVFARIDSSEIPLEV